jgi:hypothetical protein
MNPGFVLLVFAVGQPDVVFQEAQKLRADGTAARARFVEAAKAYDAIWQAGDHSPITATNRSRAHSLAGDLPGAISAIQAGLREAPTDPILRADLETLRDAVAYPVGMRPIPIREWRTRMSAWDLFIVAGFCTALLVFGLGRRFTTRDTWAVPVTGLATVGLVLVCLMLWRCHYETSQDAARPLRILIRDTPLRKGNGETYESRLDWPLPSGAEVRELFQRGGWLQVETANGSVGWLPATQVIP